MNGLAWTAVGGEMLEVEVAVLEGTGKLEPASVILVFSYWAIFWIKIAIKKENRLSNSPFLWLIEFRGSARSGRDLSVRGSSPSTFLP